MIKNKIYFFLALTILSFSCTSSEEDDCVKTILIRPAFNFSSPYGSINYPELTQEVPCNFPEPEVVEAITELPRLQEFSYEILEFEFTPDTGNNTSRLQYKIKLNNLSSKSVKGAPYISTTIDGVLTSSPFTEGCSQIDAKSSCTITRDVEESLDVAQIKNIEITNVEFIVVE